MTNASAKSLLGSAHGDRTRDLANAMEVVSELRHNSCCPSTLRITYDAVPRIRRN
jgi:hypothetical protein